MTTSNINRLNFIDFLVLNLSKERENRIKNHLIKKVINMSTHDMICDCNHLNRFTEWPLILAISFSLANTPSTVNLAGVNMSR